MKVFVLFVSQEFSINRTEEYNMLDFFNIMLCSLVEQSQAVLVSFVFQSFQKNFFVFTVTVAGFEEDFVFLVFEDVKLHNVFL